MTPTVANIAPARGMAPPTPLGQPAASPLAAHSIVPPAQPFSVDALAALYKILASENENESASQEAKAEATANANKAALAKYMDALRRAAEAAQEKHGFFDSIGLGGLLGIAKGSPILVLADMSMHMAHVTPKVIADFERDHADEITLGTKALVALPNAELLAGPMGPEQLRAAVVLGGLLVEQTGVFGRKVSDYGGAAMMIYGSGATGTATNAAIAVCADKKSSVADGIRDAERVTEPYTKWAAYAGMALGAAGSLVATFGTSSVVIVAIGIALSSSGVAINETHCLDKLIGKDAAQWLGTGLMVGGSVVTGVGAAGAAASQTAQVLEATGQSIDGLAQMRSGGERLRDAAVEHDVDLANADALEQLHDMRRLQRLVDDIVDSVKDLKEHARKVSTLVHQIVDTQLDSQTTAASMKG